MADPTFSSYPADDPAVAAPPVPTFNNALKQQEPPPSAVPTFSKAAAAQPDAGPTFTQELGESFMDVPREVVKQSVEARRAIEGDVTAPIQGKGGTAPGFMDYAARAGRTGLDVLNYITGNAALTGALTSVVGRPVDEATGIPKRTTGEVTDMALPFAGPAARIMKAPAGGSIVKDGLLAVEKLLSPTTVSDSSRATERTIRRATGQGSLEAEKASARLLEHNGLVGNLPVPAQRGLVDHIENFSTRPPLANPKLQAAAKSIADTMTAYRQRIEKILAPADRPNFVKDYFVHMWQEAPAIVGEKLNAVARQGSGRSFKKRTIPTIADGIAAGLTPKTENPIEATMAYAQNMSRFLATHDMQQELKAQGYAKWFSPGSKNVPKGWVPLNGIMTEKAVPFTRGAAAGATAGQPAAKQIKLFAPPDVARVYNNFISKGLEQGDAGPFFKGARAFANATTMLKLGLSTFHLSTMANEGIISEVARAFSAASRGELVTAGKALGRAAVAPVASYRRGLKMERELLDKAMPDAMSAKVNDAFVRSGGQVRMDPFYRTRASGSFFNAWERGVLKRELSNTARQLYHGSALEKAKGTIDLAQNVIQSVAAPLFEKYIPRLKRGAFASRMEDFIKSNPNASQDEIDKYAIKLNDSIDNRFGELVQDNLFWKRQMKQIAQIVLLSPTWDLGTVREIGGGIADLLPSAKGIMQGKGITDRTAYVAALASVVALENGVATYLKTGEKPKGRDFMAYRTGGTDATSGEPERAMMPGYQKDVYAFGYDFPHNILAESINKLNPALTETYQLGANKDYRGLPIYRPQGVDPVEGEPTVWDYLLEQNMPISIGQFTKGQKVGSNISPAEELMSIKPAPSYIQSPEHAQETQKRYGTQDWRKRIRADQRAQSRIQP